MSTAISFQASWVAPPTPDTATPRSVAAALTQTTATAAPSAPSTQSAEPQPAVPTPVVREETARDPSGLTVFRTVEIATGSLVAQFPTEAYLRLANAMREASQPLVLPGGPADRTA